MPADGLIEVRIAAPAAASERLAQLLVTERLAACVQVIPKVVSTFRWEGAVTTEPEALLLAKSHEARFERLCEVVTSAHPYDVPEIVATPIALVNEPYAVWLRSEVGLA